jgi:hypothetical protein
MMSRCFVRRFSVVSNNLPIKLISFLLALSTLCLSYKSQETDKPTLEEVITKHLESIGSAQNRKAATTRIISGTSLVVFRTEPSGQASGKVVFASDGTKNLLGMSFYSPVYPREQFSYNGTNSNAAFVTPGVRSSLGSFLTMHDFILKHGLMGGTLSSAWPLLDLATQKAKVEYVGVKRVKDQLLHELKYQPRGGSDCQVSIFLNVKTYEHTRTEYSRVVPAQMGDRSYTNVTTRESRYKLVEEFSNFKDEGGLNLPHLYMVEFSADTQSGTFLAEWIATLTQFTFNEKIDPAAFSSN